MSATVRKTERALHVVLGKRLLVDLLVHSIPEKQSTEQQRRVWTNLEERNERSPELWIGSRQGAMSSVSQTLRNPWKNQWNFRQARDGVPSGVLLKSKFLKMTAPFSLRCFMIISLLFWMHVRNTRRSIPAHLEVRQALSVHLTISYNLQEGFRNALLLVALLWRCVRSRWANTMLNLLSSNVDVLSIPDGDGAIWKLAVQGREWLHARKSKSHSCQ
eukprot:766305-Hanusia_phi.AAC.3